MKQNLKLMGYVLGVFGILALLGNAHACTG